ncbi:hypothetical protein V0M98_32520 (plasmid) [Pseudomonas silesiensis]|uniref:hypothetical protein n=1 Tax=Pseudomonas silesiensis TaxID=1853130 RepID=UPI0030D09BD7
MPTGNLIFTYTKKEPDLNSQLHLIDGGSAYVFGIGVNSEESISVLVAQIQAVYDDCNRAPDGQFTVRQADESCVFVLFTRDCAADADAIGICSSRLNTISASRQLAREFTPVEGDGPFIAALHTALINFADQNMNEQAINNRLDELEMSLNGDETDDDTRADILDEIAELKARLPDSEA